MLEQLYQTITTFFNELPSIKEMFNGIKAGNVGLLGDLFTMLSGLFTGISAE